MPTLEEASLCPRCSFPGLKMSETPLAGRRGDKAIIYHCKNERCRWLNTGWVVQVSSDGSIPTRKAGTKEVPAMTEFEKAHARRVLEQNQEDLRRGELGRRN